MIVSKPQQPRVKTRKTATVSRLSAISLTRQEQNQIRDRRHVKATLIATAKDEGHNILEWLAHHRLAGFTEFILFQNDSTDGTAEMLELLAELGVTEME